MVLARKKDGNLKKAKRKKLGIPMYSMNDGAQLVASLLHRAISEGKSWVVIEIYERTPRRPSDEIMAKIVTWVEGENRQVHPNELAQSVEYQLDDILAAWKLPRKENPISRTEQETTRRIQRKVTLHLNDKIPVALRLRALQNLF